MMVLLQHVPEERGACHIGSHGLLVSKGIVPDTPFRENILGSMFRLMRSHLSDHRRATALIQACSN
jgi:hypothetical protein